MATGVFLFAVFGFLFVSLRYGCCHDVPCTFRRQNDQVLVDCSHAGLTSLPDETWPDGVTHLDISYNQISSLAVLSSLKMRGLRHLDASHNLLQIVEENVLSHLPQLESLDLSYNQLTDIDCHSFVKSTSHESLNLDRNQLRINVSGDAVQNLSSLVQLDLGHNLLSVLRNGTFSCLKELTWLSVQANHIEKVDAEALVGLNRLVSLDLSSNHLEMTSLAFPPGVFSSLSALQELRLQNNDMRIEGEYPERVFNDLPSLHYLAMDTFSDPYFGQDFAAMTQMQTLDLGFNCKISRLSNESFHGFRFSSLRVLLLDCCHKLMRIDLCSFCNLPNLKTLQITQAYLMNPTIGLQALFGLQGQTMDRIDLSDNGNWGPDTFLIDRKTGRYLHHICVSTFVMQRSSIHRIAAGSITVKGSRFSECVQHIDFSQNCLKGDAFEILRIFLFFHRLQTLQIQDQRTYSVHEAECVLSNDCTDRVVSFLPKGLTVSFFFTFPPTLELLNVSAVFKHLSPLPPYINITQGENLRALDVSYSVMANCNTTSYGLSQLETLKLNYNYCYTISDTFLDNHASLKHLGLSNFGAPNEFFLARGKRFFQRLTRLEELDLSLNRLLRLPPDMLQGQARLVRLQLSSNRFQSVPVHLGYHDNLTSLDLSYNMLPGLTVGERAALDHLASRHQFRLQLIGNPLTCTCDNLDMVQWFGHTAVALDGVGTEGNYSCTLETGEVASTHQVLEAILPHWRKCVGIKIFTVALGLFLTQMLLLILAYVIRSHWTRLRYTWKVLRRHQLPSRLRDFSRDAYLVYAGTDNDVMWACLTLPSLLRQHRPSLRLLLPDVEPLPTMYKAENIAQHIDVSWKTVLMVTQDFSKDQWACGFAVRQAMRCTTDLTPERVLVVFLEAPPRLDPMPSLQLLLPLVPPRHVFHVHPLAPATHPVWKAIADAIVADD